MLAGYEQEGRCLRLQRQRTQCIHCLAFQMLYENLLNQPLIIRFPHNYLYFHNLQNCCQNLRQLSQYDKQSLIPGRGRIFLYATLSGLALLPTQPPVPWVLGLSPCEVKWLGQEADHSPPFHLVSRFRMFGTVPSLPHISPWCGGQLSSVICSYGIVLNKACRWSNFLQNCHQDWGCSQFIALASACVNFVNQSFTEYSTTTLLETHHSYKMTNHMENMTEYSHFKLFNTHAFKEFFCYLQKFDCV